MYTFSVGVTQKPILLRCKELNHWESLWFFGEGKCGMQSGAFFSRLMKGFEANFWEPVWCGVAWESPLKNVSGWEASSLRSKRFRLISEQRRSRRGIFGFDRARNETRAKKCTFLLAPFFARSLTLVPRSLLIDRTETLATQARRLDEVGLEKLGWVCTATSSTLACTQTLFLLFFFSFFSKTSASSRAKRARSINPLWYTFYHSRLTDFQEKIEGLWTGYPTPTQQQQQQ